VVVLRQARSASESELIDALPPRNPSGKVLKRVLRERYWQGHSRRVN
jgi:acyl-CoA synthetase (AMP-forming)/AMP-acid ligase II